MEDNVLTRIVADKRIHVQACIKAKPFAELEREAEALPDPLDFYAALAAKPIGLITEIKKASPSAGVIRENFDVAEIARAYKSSSAACLSVLTDVPYFQGHDSYIKIAKQAANLPVLRKDFVIDPYQVVEAKVIGADAVLLIAACLSDDHLSDLAHLAARHGLSILIEVHDEAELTRVLDLDLDLPRLMLGINNRNLKTLGIDLGTTERLMPLIPDNQLVVGESGIKTKADIQRLQAAGVNHFLIGENLLRQLDIAAATRSLF